TKLFRFLGIGSLLLVSPLFLIRNEDEFRRFARVFVGCAAITVVQLLFGLQATAVEGDVTRIGAGWLVGMAAIIVLFYPLFTAISYQKIFVVCALPFLIVGLMASVARGPALALLLILFIRMAIWFKEGHRGMALGLAAVFLASGVGAF